MRAKNWQKPLPWLVVAALLVLWEVCVRAFDVPLVETPSLPQRGEKGAA